jgi:hypothetical protein
VRKKVNDLLASGASYAVTLRALGNDKVVPAGGLRSPIVVSETGGVPVSTS